MPTSDSSQTTASSVNTVPATEPERSLFEVRHFLRKADHDRALALLGQLLSRFPHHVEVIREHIRCLKDAGRLTEAVEIYGYRQEHEPLVALWQYALGFAYSWMGPSYREAAVELCTRALELDPTLKWACYNIGFVRHEMGDVPGSVHYYEKAIQIDPKNDTAYVFLGQVYKQEGRNDIAERQFQNAIQANGNNITALRELKLISDKKEKEKGIFGKILGIGSQKKR